MATNMVTPPPTPMLSPPARPTKTRNGCLGGVIDLSVRRPCPPRANMGVVVVFRVIAASFIGGNAAVGRAPIVNPKGKEIDSGVPAWETPNPYVVDSTPIRNIGISLDVAQRHFPATAALFGGNLPNTVSMSYLHRELLRALGQIGECYIAIHSKITVSRGVVVSQPYAIIQFTTASDANLALRANFAQPIIIGGRALRLDFVRARRDIVVHRLDQGITDKLAIRGLMSRFGEVESIYDTACRDPRNNAVVPAVRVMFRCYGGFKTAKQTLGRGRDGYLYHYDI